jgi:hypothetical protein
MLYLSTPHPNQFGFIDLIELIWILVICFTLLFRFASFGQCGRFESMRCNVILHCAWPCWTSPAVRGSGLVCERTPASIWHPCVGSLASCNHTMQDQPINQIGVFRHRNTALFKYANRIRGIRKFLDVSKTSKFEGGREALTKPREKRHLVFSALRRGTSS